MKCGDCPFFGKRRSAGGCPLGVSNQYDQFHPGDEIRGPMRLVATMAEQMTAQADKLKDVANALAWLAGMGKVR